MTESARKHWALRFRQLLDQHVPRKQALLQVRNEIRGVSRKLPSDRASIYRWCKKFKISTK